MAFEEILGIRFLILDNLILTNGLFIRVENASNQLLVFTGELLSRCYGRTCIHGSHTHRESAAKEVTQ